MKEEAEHSYRIFHLPLSLLRLQRSKPSKFQYLYWSSYWSMCGKLLRLTRYFRELSRYVLGFYLFYTLDPQNRHPNLTRRSERLPFGAQGGFPPVE